MEVLLSQSVLTFGVLIFAVIAICEFIILQTRRNKIKSAGEDLKEAKSKLKSIQSRFVSLSEHNIFVQRELQDAKKELAKYKPARGKGGRYVSKKKLNAEK